MTSGLNENHRRALVVALAHIDGLLADAERAASEPPSPFAQIASDLTPAERDVLADYIAEARTRLTDAARTLDLSLTPPRVSAVAAIQTNLSFAEIAIAEVEPRRLRGYGDVGEEAARLVERVEGDLGRSLQRIRAFLTRRSSGDFAARLARLERAPFDLALLNVIADIAARRGLVEFRPAIEALLERAEVPTFEIAFFGRVSSGKSSLINAILQVDLLPVGVRPVTAVPTRVLWGDAPSATVHYADRAAEEVGVERLVEFVSETQNPGNRKHVARVVARLPANALAPGVAFVDTPGVGSLAAAGARETLAYLPQCDLGVVLLAAGGALERPDIELVRSLQASGIPAIVLISKADLLSVAAQRELRDYVRAELEKTADADVSMHFSSAAGGGELARAWFREELAPLLTRVQELAERSAQSKLSALREGVIANLEAALGSAGKSTEPTGMSAQGGAALEQGFLEAEGVLADARRNCQRLADEVASSADDLISDIAGTVARDLERSAKLEVPATIRAASDAASERVRAAQQAALTAARERLSEILARVAAEASWPSRLEPLTLDLISQPVLDAPPELERLDLDLPRWLPRLKSLVERYLLGVLREQVGPPLDEALRFWSAKLYRWSTLAISRLGEQFALQAEPIRTRQRRLGTGLAQAGDADGILADLYTLANWGQHAGGNHDGSRAG
jgi:GTP-binding protein EngB required for normal cell division